jgi:hypothetical protein
MWRLLIAEDGGIGRIPELMSSDEIDVLDCMNVGCLRDAMEMIFPGSKSGEAPSGLCESTPSCSSAFVD